MGKNVKVAVVQAEPVWLGLQGSVNKVIELVQEAAKNGTNVLVLNGASATVPT